MSLPTNLDLDRIVSTALDDIKTAVRSWAHGTPLDEVAFMNHLTGQMNRNRRGCNVGVTDPITVRTAITKLHRQGVNRTDHYGTDLAITIYADRDSYVKTALFQIKKSRDYHITIDKSQLDQASVDQRILNRAFVLAVDEKRLGIRLQAVSEVGNKYRAGADSRSFNCSAWTPLTEWIVEWLSCRIGPESNSQNSVESILQNYAHEPMSDDILQMTDVEYSLPAGYTPSRSWAQFYFESKSPVAR